MCHLATSLWSLRIEPGVDKVRFVGQNPSRVRSFVRPAKEILYILLTNVSCENVDLKSLFFKMWLEGSEFFLTDRRPKKFHTPALQSRLQAWPKCGPPTFICGLPTFFIIKNLKLHSYYRPGMAKVRPSNLYLRPANLFHYEKLKITSIL